MPVFREIPVAGITTVTVQVAVLPYFSVAVIVAVPAPTAVSTPSTTVTTFSFDVVQLTLASLTSVGRTIAFSVSV